MPDPIAITFEYTDDMAAQAARENWIALGRRSFSPGSIAIVAASTAIFGVALRAHTSLLWQILSAAAPTLVIALSIIWIIGLWWVPRAAQKKLARLTHRNVTVEFGDDELTIVTSNERLALKWTEVRELRELERYLVLVLEATEIPIPREAVSPEAQRRLESKLAMQPPREPIEEPAEKKPEPPSEEEIKEVLETAPVEPLEKPAEEPPKEAPQQTPEEPPDKTPEK